MEQKLNSEELAPGIISFEGVLEDPKQFILDLEASAEINKIMWNDATQSNGKKDSESKVEKAARNCKAISLPPFDRLEEEHKVGPYYEIHNFLNESLNPVFDIYCNTHFAPHWKQNEGWQILKYGVENYFVNHYDDSKQYPRTMSMSYYLNDDYEGGEIEFSRFNLKIKPKANQAIFFPANYVYNHTVHPVTSGTRYAVVGWWE